MTVNGFEKEGSDFYRHTKGRKKTKQRQTKDREMIDRLINYS